MGQICLFLPANSFHGNLDRGRWDEIRMAGAGLKAFGQNSIKINFSCQELDLYVWPWIKELVAEPSVEWLKSTRSHTLINMNFPKEFKWWEVKNEIGESDVSFFAEFAPPEPQFIQTKYFLVLGGHTHYYSLYTVDNKVTDPYSYGTETDARPLAVGEQATVSYGNKTGLVMQPRLFKPFLDAFFYLQRYPDKENLDRLVQVIRKISDSDIDVIVPIDMEAPFIGSFYGADIWKMLAEEIDRQGLNSVFANFRDIAWPEAERNQGSVQLDRLMTKWTCLKLQLDHYLAVRDGMTSAAKARNYLASVAAGSDIYAAWERKILGKTEPKSFTAIDKRGNEQQLGIGYSQDVIDIQKAAYFAVKHGSKLHDETVRLEDKFGREINPNFVQSLTNL